MTDKITVLYDTIRLEEKLLIKAAERHDINIEMVDCRQLFVDLNKNTQEFETVLQRCVSYYRNIHSTATLEGLGARVINCLNTGLLAGNKLFTHMLLQKAGIPTPEATIAFSKESAIESKKRSTMALAASSESSIPFWEASVLNSETIPALFILIYNTPLAYWL